MEKRAKYFKLFKRVYCAALWSNGPKHFLFICVTMYLLRSKESLTIEFVKSSNLTANHYKFLPELEVSSDGNKIAESTFVAAEQTRPTAAAKQSMSKNPAAHRKLGEIKQNLRNVNFDIYQGLTAKIRNENKFKTPGYTEPQIVSASEVCAASFSQETCMGKPDLKVMSIVIVALNEHEYIERTLRSIFNTVSKKHLQEVIIIDDASDPPLNSSYNVAKYNLPTVRYFRNAERQGLTRSKVLGGNLAHGSFIMFLDAHVRPDPGWLLPILKLLNGNYKRIVVPVIIGLSGDSWKPEREIAGYKMFFDWSLNFNWYDDFENDLVPIFSGGIFAVTKRWWYEIGQFNPAMKQWGAENIEMSFRTWLCGGEIVVARKSTIAHLFRSKFPYPVDSYLLLKNKVYVVESWLDGFSENFYKRNPLALELKNALTTAETKYNHRTRMKCNDFNWFVDKFKKVFYDHELLDQNPLVIVHKKTGSCVWAEESSESVPSTASYTLKLQDCDTQSASQQWSFDYYRKSLYNIGLRKCASVSHFGDGTFLLSLVECKEGEKQQHFLIHEGSIISGSLCLTAHIQEAKENSYNTVVLSLCEDSGINEKQEIHTLQGASDVSIQIFDTLQVSQLLASK